MEANEYEMFDASVSFMAVIEGLSYLITNDIYILCP
jgi:hypothetical protein